jgi:hypothetical protein
MRLAAAEMLGTHPCHLSLDCGSNEALGIIRLLQLCPHPIVILISPETNIFALRDCLSVPSLAVFRKEGCQRTNFVGTYPLIRRACSHLLAVPRCATSRSFGHPPLPPSTTSKLGRPRLYDFSELKADFSKNP